MDAEQTARQLADMLNRGMGQSEAVDALGLDPDAISTESPCLVLDDPDNDIIDPCDGWYVQRGATGHWWVRQYDKET